MTEVESETLKDEFGSRDTGLQPVFPFLFVVLECDRPLSGGARYALGDVDEVLVGRGSSRRATLQKIDGVRRLVVTIPSRSMSATHARFERTKEGWVLEDARSTNGSIVNGARVNRAVLREGDVIELGHTIFLLRAALPKPPGTLPILDTEETPATDAALATLHPGLSREFETLARFAGSKLGILLLGETGTGKEVTSRAIHRLSGRSGPFVAANCGALPSNLVESLLFGHVRGAFSGAVRDEPGLFRSADGGTLLLDEIGDLPLAAQPALLRVLQESEVVPVGAARPIAIDVRLIAATHRSLDRLAQDQRFRPDLLARLDGYRFSLPNLRERREDMGLLVASVLAAAGADANLAIAPDAVAALVAHRWPFNVRELVQVLNRALVLTEGRVMTRDNLSSVLSADEGPPVDDRASLVGSPAELEQRRELIDSLERHGGNVARAARAMGTSRMQVHRMLRRFGLDVTAFRRRARLARAKEDS
jgi:DNA-binding NtrC family response regulator